MDGDLGYPDYPPYRDPFLTTYRSFGEDFSPTKVIFTDLLWLVSAAVAVSFYIGYFFYQGILNTPIPSLRRDT